MVKKEKLSIAIAVHVNAIAVYEDSLQLNIPQLKYTAIAGYS